jgi:hypothetical protein
MIAFDLVLLTVSILLLTATRLTQLREHDGALIGAAAGALFGLSDIAIKALIGASGHGVAVLLSPWLMFAALSGLSAQYLSGRSLQTGDAVSVTALTAATANIANITAGIIVFGDPLAHGLTGSLIEATGFTLICTGALLTPIRAQLARTQRERDIAWLAEPGPGADLSIDTARHDHGVRDATPIWAAMPAAPNARLAGWQQAIPTQSEPEHSGSASPRGPVNRAASSIHDAQDEHMPLAGQLAITGLTLLVASKISDWFEPYVGFDVFNFAFAFVIAVTVACPAALLTDSLLRSLSPRSHATTRAVTTVSLVALGAAPLAVIAVEHLHHQPAPDDWLGIAGALLMLTAAAAARHHGRRRPTLLNT